MPTAFEKRISSVRKQQGGILVPMLNELLKAPLRIETKEDADFLYALAMKQVLREQIRGKAEGGVYSPSGIGSCMRRVYLSKNHKRLGFERVELPSIESHYYFFTGDFIHLKWQFALYKLSLAHPDFWLIECEYPILSKRKDHGGTIDVICLCEGELLIIDAKGLNFRSFQQHDNGNPSMEYRLQIADYIMLWNSMVERRKLIPSPEMQQVLGSDSFPTIRRGLILVENKIGPDAKHPSALTEVEVKVADMLPLLRGRLKTLRGHEEDETIPEIECDSTKRIAFTGCPFAEYCRKEVRKAEKAIATDRNPDEYRISKPIGTHRSRKSRSK